jgi:hypothetical protein
LSPTDIAYRVAFNEAVAKADRLNADIGIARNIFNGYDTFVLPRPENRRGHELRCEVVRPGTPRMPVDG